MRKKVDYVNLKQQHIILRSELTRAFNAVLNDSMFILGKQVKELEKKFAEYVGSKYCVSVNSGTDSLFLALKALSINRNTDVITVPNSFLATASAIKAVNAKITFVDVDKDMNMNPNLIDEAIRYKTSAILPVHLTGRPAKMDKIMEVAESHNLKVIEDCAQAIGTKYNGKHVGTFGVCGCFSFHPLKTLNACGDGGAIVTDNERVYKKLLQLRNIGLKNRNEADIWGYNSRLDTLQASFLLVKMKYVNYWIQQRRSNAKIYSEQLKDVVDTPTENKNEYCTYHTYMIRTKSRDYLQDYLRNNNIYTAIHYPIPIHLQKCAEKLGYKEGDFPETEQQSKEILSLPVYGDLKREDLLFVIEEIKKWKNAW